MLTFAYPWVFLLAPLPVLVAWLAPLYRETRAAPVVPFLDRAKEAVGGGAGAGGVARRGLTATLVAWLVWLLLLAATARPQWLEPPVEQVQPARDLLLLVDLSGSMEHEDFTNAEGETVSRLDAVKAVLDGFLDQRTGDRVGIVVFGTAPFVQVPFTDDLELCRELLDELQPRMAGPRTAFGDAIGLGLKLFEDSKMPSKVMIALTDGNDTGSLVPPPEAAKIAARQSITIHTVAVGDPAAIGEEKLDVDALREVAKTTGGTYSFADDRKALAETYRRIDEIETVEATTISHRPRIDWFWIPLLAALGATLLLHGVSAARRLVRTRAEAPEFTPRVIVDRWSGEVRVESRPTP